jgi:CRISPR-associated protein Cas5d
MKNSIEFEVFGNRALFTDPLTKKSGEKFSYRVPTYEAVKGIVESIYWKPTIIWIVDKIRIMNEIVLETKGIRFPFYEVSYTDTKYQDIFYHTYLKEVRYQVQAHFEWSSREDLKEDRKIEKHSSCILSSLDKGGRRDIFLGTRECSGYVLEKQFGTDIGFYDDIEYLNLGSMFHGFDYPAPVRKRFWNAEMKKGIILFPNPKDCK